MSSKILLYDGPPLVVSPSLIQRVGMNEAFVLQQVHYWINPNFNKNVFDGKHWVRNTYRQWQKQFPFWTVKKIRSIFTLLEKRNILLSFTTFHNFQKIKYYTLNYESLEVNVTSPQETLDFLPCAQNGRIEEPVLELDLKNRVEKSQKLQENSASLPWAQNGLMHGPKMGSPIAPNGYIHEPKMGTSYIDTEITYRDYFLYSPLLSPLKILNLRKKVLNEEESRLKKIQEKKAIKNLRDPDADHVPAFLGEGSNPEWEADSNNKLRELSGEDSNGSKTFREITGNISEETCQKMGKVWNEEVQRKLQGCWSEIRLTPERSQKLNFFLEEFLNNDFEAWRSYCQKISRYRFLMGESKSGFRVTFDWAIKPQNALKVLEGAIYDKPQTEDEGRLIEKPWVEYTQSLKEHCTSKHYPEGWFEVCKFLSRQLGQATFENWFKHIEPELKDEHTLWLLTGTPFLQDYITTHYRDFLETAIRSAFPKVTEFKIQAAVDSSNLQEDGFLTHKPLCRTIPRQSVGKDLGPDSQGDAFVSTEADPGRETPGSEDIPQQERQK